MSSVARQERLGAKSATAGQAQAAQVAPSMLSSLEHSHRAPVSALHWLPGVFISKQGSRPPTVRRTLVKLSTLWRPMVEVMSA